MAILQYNNSLFTPKQVGWAINETPKSQSTRIKKTKRKMENKAKKNRKGEKRGNFAVSHTIERSELLLY
jgi:hypothetical protein